MTVPTADLIAGGDADLVLQQQGTGRLYYRLGLRYAPDDLTLDPLDRGFVVQRAYEAVDDPADVSRDADGTWRITAGARVRVRVTMVAESQRTHAALVDPLPAGLEIVNPDLATTPDVPADPTLDPSKPTPFSRCLVEVGEHLVRPSEPARRPGRGLRHPAPRRRLRLQLRRPGHDAGHVRRAAGPGRGDLRARDVRPQRHRHRRHRLKRGEGSSPRTFPGDRCRVIDITMIIGATAEWGGRGGSGRPDVRRTRTRPGRPPQ